MGWSSLLVTNPGASHLEGVLGQCPHESGQAQFPGDPGLSGGEFRVVHVDEGDRDAVADRQRRDARAHDAGTEDHEVVVWLPHIGRLLALGSEWCRARQSPASRPDRPDSAARVSA